jgi:septal ring factor EnvC (AmiA/AmiB activator)
MLDPMFRALTLVLLTCLCGATFADERADARRQLEAARAEVAELKASLKKLEQEKSSAQRQLKATETRIGELEKDVRKLRDALDEGAEELKRLAREKAAHETARIEQQRLIAIQARAAYQSGRQEYLKLLLNQQAPERFARTLTYYDYLSKARMEQLETFNETLRQLANIERDIVAQQIQLETRKAELDQRAAALAEERKQRRQVLAKLDSEHGAGSQRLKKREQDQQQFDQLLKTIEATLARQAREREAEQARLLAQRQAAEQRARAGSQNSNQTSSPRRNDGPLVSAGAGVSGSFGQARGKLPWPVDGRLLARYGTPRGDDVRTKWDGVLIGAGAGSRVRAVHGGRVVFADWLRGAGLLVIVDHGDGYLSLYGHNQSLLAAAGDMVQAGDAIATVGTSGGQNTPALYFAIRKQGQPTDPAQWCRG